MFYPSENGESLDFSSGRDKPSRRLRHERETNHDEKRGYHTDADHGPPLARVRFEQIGTDKASSVPVLRVYVCVKGGGEGMQLSREKKMATRSRFPRNIFRFHFTVKPLFKPFQCSLSFMFTKSDQVNIKVFGVFCFQRGDFLGDTKTVINRGQLQPFEIRALQNVLLRSK